MDIFKSNIKSRKALQLAINDKSVPVAIKRLRMTTNIVIVALLSLSIIEFVTINKQFTDINENFNLIEQSYGRISELQRIAYDIRSLIMIRENKFTAYENYLTEGTDFKEFLRNDMEEALNNLYEIQNKISLASLSMSTVHQTLLDTKTINLYFKEHDSSLKSLKFSLTESVLQISSSVFTSRYLEESEFYEDQEDLYFVTYNVFNDLLEALRLSSEYYVTEL